MEPINPEPCTWDPSTGALHQHFCRHVCHSNPIGFGHILVCCGRECLTTDVRCSARCQRPYAPAFAEPPVCPYCGPWTHEARLLNLLEGVEFWFHFFGLLYQTEEVRGFERKLREHQASIVASTGESWVAIYEEVGSTRQLRERLAEAVEEQRVGMVDMRRSSWRVSGDKKLPPIPDQQARDWYSSEEAAGQQGFVLEDFLWNRGGALDFFAAGDDERDLRMDMVAYINQGLAEDGWPPQTETNERRLLALFDRELFHNHICNAGYIRPDLIECDRQMLIYKGEQLVVRSGGYWACIEELVGSQSALDMTLVELEAAFGWLLDSVVLSTIQPIFDWLTMAAINADSFQTGIGMFGAVKCACADQLLRGYEAETGFGGLLSWSEKTIICFLRIAEMLQATSSDRTAWAQTQRCVGEVTQSLTVVEPLRPRRNASNLIGKSS